MLPIVYYVIPCYNDAQTLSASAPVFLQTLKAQIAQESIHPDSRVLFVNDGSADGTWEKIVSLHAQDDHIAGADLAFNAGEQNALLAGMHAAVQKADCVITMDSDLQDDVTCTGEMLRRFCEGSGVVLGVRIGRRDDPTIERITSACFYFVMEKLRTGLVREHSNFTLLSREAVKRVLQTKPPFFLPCLVCTLGLPTSQVLYIRKNRAAGESGYTLHKRLQMGLHAAAAHTAARRLLPPERDPPFVIRTTLGI